MSGNPGKRLPGVISRSFSMCEFAMDMPYQTPIDTDSDLIATGIRYIGYMI